MNAATLILWSHALAALLFGGLAIHAWRSAEMGLPRRPLTAALALTALWALAVAGIGAADLATRIVETARNFAWLGFMIVLHRRADVRRTPIALTGVYGVVGLVAGVALVLHIVSIDAPRSDIAGVALLLRMLVAVAALVLVQALYSTLGGVLGPGLRWIVIALAGIWASDFALFGATYLIGEWRNSLVATRGFADILIGLALAGVLQRKGAWDVQVSRTVTYQSLSLVAVGAYFALLALATSALATVGGDNARVLQTAFVLGSTVAILTLVSNSWLRAWIKVKLAKHLFRHRYDYRAEWMRFTDTLGASQGAAPLDQRIVKAVADLTDSPAGLLLVPDGEGLAPGAHWNWQRTGSGDAALAAHLAATGRIVDLDAVRREGTASADFARVPQWMLDAGEAWVLVPLPHLGALAGAILLARPPVTRPLDWEDLDLLKVAGRQAGSYLAEARAQEALAEAQRFDEFNRRFAFILHDIKNLVSQLTLTARNAERHADNPAFRADMVATLRGSADRMNALLARLSQHHRSRTEPAQAMDVVPLVHAIAAVRGRQHPIAVAGDNIAMAHADRATLDKLLGHLIQNAVEASPADAPVTLDVRGQGRDIAITVADRGCGMSAAFVRDKLFKPFVSSKSGGFGIGAFEARQLAAAMGGRLDVASREGEGTRFTVILKAAHAADLPGQEAA